MTFETYLKTRHQALDALVDLHAEVETAAEMIITTLRHGRKLMLCGNGGSGAEAQHFTGELVGRFQSERRPLAAISLNADSVSLTCIANDFGSDQVFSRQVEALGQCDDLLVAMSTSGNSPAIVEALRVAEGLGLRSLALLGRNGGDAKGLATHEIVVPNMSTALTQESHLLLIHFLCERIEQAFPVAVRLCFPPSTA